MPGGVGGSAIFSCRMVMDICPSSKRTAKYKAQGKCIVSTISVNMYLSLQDNKPNWEVGYLCW